MIYYQNHKKTISKVNLKRKGDYEGEVSEKLSKLDLEIENNTANSSASSLDQSYEMEMALNDSGLSFSSLMSHHDPPSNLLEIDNDIQLNSML